MSLNDSLTGLFESESTRSKIGSLFGIDSDATGNTVAASIPALLGGLADRSGEPGGQDAVSQLVAGQDDSILDDLGGSMSNRSSEGDASMLSTIFGAGGATKALSGIATSTGVSLGAVTKMLPALAPVVLGFLKRKVSTDGLSASGLTALLQTEKAELASSGKSGALGLGALGGLGAAGAATAAASTGALGGAAGKITGGAKGAAASATGAVGAVGGTAGKITGGAAGKVAGAGAAVTGAGAAGKERSGLPKWLWPLLLVIAAIIIIPLLISQCASSDDDGDTAPVASEAPAVSEAAPESTDAPAAEPTEAPDLNTDLRGALDGAGFGDINGAVDGDVATLTGMADSDATKQAAGDAALGVDGINSVDNQIEVAAPATNSIVDIAVSNPDFSTLAGAVTSAGLADALSSDGPFTVFAPTNDAFAALDAVPEGDALADVLSYHVVPGNLTAADLQTGTLTTLQGQELDVVVGDDGAVTVNGANVITADVIADNGVIHAIDGVLVPTAAPDTGAVLAIDNITFEPSSAVITAEGQAVLDAQGVPFLTEQPDVRVQIGGHTDSDGSDANNQTLSQARADAVRTYLVDNGIATERMETVGFGASEPIAPNDTAENKALNRRIEFKVL